MKRSNLGKSLFNSKSRNGLFYGSGLELHRKVAPILSIKTKVPTVVPTILLCWLVLAGVSGQIHCSSQINGGIKKKQPIDQLLTKGLYEKMFPHRDTLYSYASFLKACDKFPLFAQAGNDQENKRELMAFFANVAHETTGGWEGADGGPYYWGLVYKEELACLKKPCPVYNTSGDSPYKPVKNKNYHGRGPLQLSYAYNYGLAGEELGLPLLEHPETVCNNGVTAFSCAIWFWMKAQPPKPSCHDVMLGKWKPGPSDKKNGRFNGFGMTINIINGGLECGRNTLPALAKNRIERIGFFKTFCRLIGVPPGPNCDCSDMKSF